MSKLSFVLAHILIDDIVKNIKFSHGIDKVCRHDQKCPSFSVNVSESVCLSRNRIWKKSVGFIFLTIPRLGKRRSCISELISVKVYTSGDHLLPKTPGNESMTWSWKQKLVGVSRKCGISWKIMKLWKLKKTTSTVCCYSEYWYICQTLKCSYTWTSWTCVDFLKLDNGLGQVVIQLLKSPHKSNSFGRESISKLPGGNVFYLWSVVIISDLPILKCSHD